MKSLVANKRDGLVKFALRVPRAVGKRFRKHRCTRGTNEIK